MFVVVGGEASRFWAYSSPFYPLYCASRFLPLKGYEPSLLMPPNYPLDGRWMII
jgi:hypothetical protein